MASAKVHLGGDPLAPNPLPDSNCGKEQGLDLMDAGGSGMAFVEKFGHAMIETFLEGDDLQFLRDRDGDFVVEFGYDEEISGYPRFLLAISGDDGEQYCLRGDAMRRVQRADWDRTLRLCNEWNTLYKMPKVYFEVDDPNASTTGRVVCEQWLNLQAGIHQELVSHLTSSFFSSCFGFWRWLERQDAFHSLGDPDEPDESTPENGESEAAPD